MNRVKVDKENLITETKLSDLLAEVEAKIKPFRHNWSVEAIGSGDTIQKVRITAEIFIR